MAATNLTIEVQEYLDKHKINALFEDMREKVIKNLPTDPISYLITVLKTIQERKKRAVSSRDSTSSSRSGVIGRPVKPVSTDKLAKSSDNMRPHSTSTPKRLPLQSGGAPAITTRSGSKLRAPQTPTTPKTASSATPKVASTVTPRTVSSTTKDTPRPLKDTPRPSKTSASRIARTNSVPSKSSSSTTRPSTAPTNGQPKTPTRNTKPSSSRVAARPATSKTSPTKTTSTKTTPTKSANGTAAKRVLKPTTPTTTVKASDETIDEFFGEKKKSSSKQLLVSEQEEITELEGKRKPSVDEETELEGKGKPSVDEETELAEKGKPSVDEEMELEGTDKPSVDEETELAGKDKPSSEETGMVSTGTPSEDTTIIDAYLQKKKSQNKDAARSEHLETLQDMILTDQKSAECSNHDNDEDDEGEQPVALLEDIEVLQEEEGVDAIKSQDGHTVEVTKKQVVEHRTMTMGDVTADTAEEDFESASQITSQVNFPSWDASTMVTEESSGDSQKPRVTDDNDSIAASTATTATSKDEWAGLTQAHPPPISDSESEVQVPQVPLSGKSCTPPPTQESQTPSNNDDDDSIAASTATTATSKDEWAVLTQAHPPPISDSESEVQVPQVPLSGKSCTPPPTQESQTPSNYDDDDSTAASMATTATSKDEWEGLTQAHPPLISDSESEVQVPKVPLSGKSWTPPPTHESDDPTTAQQWAT